MRKIIKWKEAFIIKRCETLETGLLQCKHKELPVTESFKAKLITFLNCSRQLYLCQMGLTSYHVREVWDTENSWLCFYFLVLGIGHRASAKRTLYHWAGSFLKGERSKSESYSRSMFQAVFNTIESAPNTLLNENKQDKRAHSAPQDERSSFRQQQKIVMI